MSNMQIWDDLSYPPAYALKPIAAGRLKGKTDINPQWRLQAMTEKFGAIGLGWYYKIVRTWTENGASGELMCFVNVNLFIKDSGEWSMPIEGLGGSALVAKESAGLYANDEGYKMALTDALSVAMKQLGIASAIYEGLWDGAKYREVNKQPALKDKDYIESLSSADSIENLDLAWSKIPFDKKTKEFKQAAIQRKKELIEQQIRSCQTKDDLIALCNSLPQHVQDAHSVLIGEMIDSFVVKGE